jgi:uncharacterized membrane protein
MDKSDRYRNLRFERRAWFFNRRLIAVGLALALFVISWLIIPQNFLFFLLLTPVVGVVWAATYGWHQPFSTLLGYLRRIERFFSEVSNDFK